MQGHRQRGAVPGSCSAASQGYTARSFPNWDRKQQGLPLCITLMGQGYFQSCQVLQAQHISQTSNSRLAGVTRELSWGSVSGHSDCSVGKHHKHALTQKGILNRAKNIEDEPKSLSSLKQSRVFSVTAMKSHFPEIPPCPSMCFTAFVVLQFICTQLNSKVTLVFALCSSTNHKGKSMWC